MYYFYLRGISFYAPFISFLFLFMYLILLCIFGKCCSCHNAVCSFCKVIIVTLARGLFGASTIRRKDNMNPPCLKINGQLYEANAFVFCSLAYYTMAMLIVILLVFPGFSVHQSLSIDGCSDHADCFYFNESLNDTFNSKPTPVVNCSLPNEMKIFWVECYSGFQPAVLLALIGGFISFVVPLIFHVADFVHSYLIFEKFLKYNIKTNCKRIAFIILLKIILCPSISVLYVFATDFGVEDSGSDGNFKHFLKKDTTYGQMIAILSVFAAFLFYPWFCIGRHRHYRYQSYSIINDYRSSFNINNY